VYLLQSYENDYLHCDVLILKDVHVWEYEYYRVVYEDDSTVHGEQLKDKEERTVMEQFLILIN